jgi:hypothetical protein
MKTKKHARVLAWLTGLVLSLMAATGKANTIPEIPQIPAFLPISSSVPMTKKLPIDGEWMISAIRKRIRIEGGRAYALDSWVHMFVLKIEPHMVVMKDIRRTAPGQYSGQDLPLMGPLTAQLMPDGSLHYTVAGILGPVKLKLLPLRMDDQRALDREKNGGSSSAGEDYGDEESGSDEDGYGDDGYDEEGYDEESGDEYGDEEYEDDEDYTDADSNEDFEEEYEDEAPKKVAAIKIRRAMKGCKGKQIYQSGTSCFSCPKGYRRFSPTRKMTHPRACTQRGFGNDTVKAKYRWELNGCPKGLFKHKGYCKSCPEGTKRIHVAGLDTGYCRVLAF